MFDWKKRGGSNASGTLKQREPAPELAVARPAIEDMECYFDSDIGPLLYAIEPALKRGILEI